MKRRGGCLTIFLLFVFVIVALNIENYFFSHIEGAIAGAAAGDWLVDKIADTGKSIGKAVKGTWHSVTSFCGGGQQAYG